MYNWSDLCEEFNYTSSIWSLATKTDQYQIHLLTFLISMGLISSIFLLTKVVLSHLKFDFYICKATKSRRSADCSIYTLTHHLLVSYFGLSELISLYYSSSLSIYLSTYKPYQSLIVTFSLGYLIVDLVIAALYVRDYNKIAVQLMVHHLVCVVVLGCSYVVGRHMFAIMLLCCNLEISSI